jgi:glutamate-5-semialdehyde dehydrogenase
MSKGAEEIAKAAKAAFEASQLVSSQERSDVLLAVKAELERQKDVILEANRKDMEVGDGVETVNQIDN